jgi:hypothetical protein
MKQKKDTLLKFVRYTSMLLVILFGIVAIVASGGGDDDDDSPDDTATYSISGTITLASDSTALANITVALSGSSSSSTTTGTDGSYTFTELEAGDYTITPNTATGYTFNPVNADVTISNANVTDKDFAATQISAAKFLHYSLPNQYEYTGLIEDEAEALFSGYTLTSDIDYGGGVLVSGYSLNQFVDKDTVNSATPDPEDLFGTLDARELYTVVVYSHPTDGAFSNRSKFIGQGLYNYDLRWDQFNTGYLLDLNYSGKTYFPSDDIGKMYDNKYANDMYMFRKIDVKRPDAAGTVVTFEPQATTDNYVDDTQYTVATETTSGDPSTGLSTTKFIVATKSFGDYTDVKAISMDQFLTTYVTDTPLSYTYKIVALDDSKSQTGWTYDQMQKAYYLPDLDFIIQVDASNTVVEGTKINYPVRIEVISGSAVEYDFSTANPPAFVPNE